MLRTRGITRLRVFGSHARNEAKTGSDVDLVADFDAQPSLLELIAIEQEIAVALGTKVDLATSAGLRPRVRARIEARRSMPSRTDRDWLLDILEEADLLAGAVAGKSLAEFEADPALQRAVLHMLQTIGEAAGQTFAAIPGVPWQQIRGMRNRIVHGYFGIDLGAVWLTATGDAANVAAKVRASGLV